MCSELHRGDPLSEQQDTPLYDYRKLSIKDNERGDFAPAPGLYPVCSRGDQIPGSLSPKMGARSPISPLQIGNHEALVYPGPLLLCAKWET